MIAGAQARWPAVRAGLISCAAVLLAATQLHAATVFDPALRFRTLTTEHFVIYFHQGEAALTSGGATPPPCRGRAAARRGLSAGHGEKRS